MMSTDLFKLYGTIGTSPMSATWRDSNGIAPDMLTARMRADSTRMERGPEMKWESGHFVVRGDLSTVLHFVAQSKTKNNLQLEDHDIMEGSFKNFPSILMGHCKPLIGGKSANSLRPILVNITSV